MAQIIDEFSAHKVALVVPAQGIDTSEGNPAGKLQLHILCAVVEFECEIIRERVNAGVALIIPAGGIDTSKVPGKVVLDTLD